jgi:Ni,Fe-hydrogenase III large subunit
VLADELIGLTVALSELAYELGSDPDTLRQHMSSLQAVDRITQTRLAVADMLRSTAPIAERVAEVTLEDMAIRLREALGPAARGAGAGCARRWGSPDTNLSARY